MTASQASAAGGVRDPRPRVTGLDARRASSTTLLALVLALLAAYSSSRAPGSFIGLLDAWLPLLAILLLQGAALLWGSVAPARVLVIVSALPLAVGFLDLAGIWTVTTVPMMVAAYVMGTQSSGARVRAGAALATLLLAATGVLESAWAQAPLLTALNAVALIAAVLGGPLLIASLIAARQRLVDALTREKDAQERMHGALLDAALAEQRGGMARELHDIAAHHMAGIALMCAAVERQIPTDLDAARAGVVQIRVQSRLVLGDLRQAVGMLRGGADHAVEAHRIDAVLDLVAARPDGSDPVSLHVRRRTGHRPLGEGLGPLSHLTGYRMVQESLSNVAKHAPGARTAVSVDDSSLESLAITVTNESPSLLVHQEQSAGLGLRGMRERAQLVGGSLDYGLTTDGGWHVTLRLPRTGSEDEGDAR